MSASSDNQHETKINYFTPTEVSKYVNTIINSPLYNEWITSLIYSSLELHPVHILVDMSCDPDLQSIIILNRMKNQTRVIDKYRSVPERHNSKQLIDYVGMDTSQSMLDNFRKVSNLNPSIETVCMDAVTFDERTENLFRKVNDIETGKI